MQSEKTPEPIVMTLEEILANCHSYVWDEIKECYVPRNEASEEDRAKADEPILNAIVTKEVSKTE